jgi:hypothetical protein
MSTGVDWFPWCWTHEDALAQLALIVSSRHTFENEVLKGFCTDLDKEIRNEPTNVIRHGIELYDHKQKYPGLTRPVKNRLLCLLNLADTARYPFDNRECELTFTNRELHEELYTRQSVLMWDIGVQYKDWRAWQWEDPGIPLRDEQIAKALLTLHQRIWDISNKPSARVAVNYNYNRRRSGPGPGGGGGGGGGGAAVRYNDDGPGPGGDGGGGAAVRYNDDGPGDGGDAGASTALKRMRMWFHE